MLHPSEDKHAARIRGRTARQGIPDEDRVLYAATAAERLLALPELIAARLVLTYGASPEEIDPSRAVAALRERGAIVAFPRITGPQRLTLHRIDDDSLLVQGPFGLLEPCEEAPLVEKGDVDVAIVPGVAFDVSCQRIGHGGGYYDQLLPALGRALAVGLAFDEQVFPEVPAHDHDVSVDVLVTPSRTLRRPASASVPL